MQWAETVAVSKEGGLRGRKEGAQPICPWRRPAAPGPSLTATLLALGYTHSHTPECRQYEQEIVDADGRVFVPCPLASCPLTLGELGSTPLPR